jgi:exodeoxyribonuclease V alpha subunit
MNSWQSFIKIWEQLGTIDINTKKLSPDKKSPLFYHLVTLVHHAGLISDFNIRRMHMLSAGQNSELLNSLLLLFEISLNRGDSRLSIPFDKDKMKERVHTLINDTYDALLNSADADMKRYAKDINKDELIEQFNNLLNNESLTGALKNKAFPIFTIAPAESDSNILKPIIGCSDKEGIHLYANRLYYSEQSICKIMAERLREAQITTDDSKLKDILQEVLIKDTFHINSTKVIINHRQQMATIMSYLNKTVLITGGPGTGKTSVVVQILRSLIRLDDSLVHDIAICAPTGRAAARLEESISNSISSISYEQKEPYAGDQQLAHLKGVTLHRLLGYKPNNTHFTYNASHKLPARIVVLDEFSMVDLRMFSSLLEALNNDCRLILLGDRNQLPSVDTGAVLGDLSDTFYHGPLQSLSTDYENKLQALLPDSGSDRLKEYGTLSTDKEHILRDKLVILEESHRSEKSILELAEAINHEDKETTEDRLTYNELLNPEEKLWPVPRPDEKGVLKCEPSGIRLMPSSKISVDGITKDFFPNIVSSWIKAHFTDTENQFQKEGELNSYKQALEKWFEQRAEIGTERVINEKHNVHTILVRLRHTLDEARILCINKNGDRGVYSVNKQACELCFKTFNPDADFCKKYKIKAESKEAFTGMPVIINRNSKENRLSNGDVGILLQTNYGMAFCIERKKDFELIPLQKIPDWQPAFAMTVHKSQGSEFDHVLLVLPTESNRLMTREILYTGVTRAKYFCGICGDPNLFSQSVCNRVERDSGIPEYLNGIKLAFEMH